MAEALFQSIEIETLSYCNLRCATCPVAVAPRERTVMPTETFRRLVDELAAVDYAGALSPHFYNEPFADGRLPELMAYAAMKLPRARLLVFTNATLLTRELFEAMPSAIAEYVVTTDDETIRAAFERLMAELDPAQRAKFRARSIAAGALFSRGGVVSLPGLRPVRRCSLPSRYCAVNAAGDVVLCYNDYLGKGAQGNIHRASLLEVWNAPDNVARRAAVARGEFSGEPCSKCETNVSQEELA